MKISKNRKRQIKESDLDKMGFALIYDGSDAKKWVLTTPVKNIDPIDCATLLWWACFDSFKRKMEVSIWIEGDGIKPRVINGSICLKKGIKEFSELESAYNLFTRNKKNASVK